MSLSEKLILASASKTRLSMFEKAGLGVESMIPRVDEEAVKIALMAEGATADHISMVLAELKAKSVMRRAPDRMVLAADQVLRIDGGLISKAKNRQEAIEILQTLSGKSHELISSAVLMEEGQRIWQASQKAKLTVRALSLDFIHHYLDQLGDDAYWSVGCYQLEGLGAQLFQEVKGDYYTILGMPFLPLLKFLRDRGDMMK